MKSSILENPSVIILPVIFLFVLAGCDLSNRESIEIIHPPTIQDSISSSPSWNEGSSEKFTSFSNSNDYAIIYPIG